MKTYLQFNNLWSELVGTNYFRKQENWWCHQMVVQYYNPECKKPEQIGRYSYAFAPDNNACAHPRHTKCCKIVIHLFSERVWITSTYRLKSLSNNVLRTGDGTKICCNGAISVELTYSISLSYSLCRSCVPLYLSTFSECVYYYPGIYLCE